MDTIGLTVDTQHLIDQVFLEAFGPISSIGPSSLTLTVSFIVMVNKVYWVIVNTFR